MPGAFKQRGEHRVEDVIDRALHALAYPADNIQETLVVVLVVVAFGLLLAVILMALASPGAKRN